MAGILEAHLDPPQDSVSCGSPSAHSPSDSDPKSSLLVPQSEKKVACLAPDAPFLKISELKEFRKPSKVAAASRSLSDVIPMDCEGLAPELSFYPFQTAMAAADSISPPPDVINQGTLFWGFTLVGHFLDSHPHFLAVKTIAKKIWTRFGLKHVAGNEAGFFFFRFASLEQMENCLRAGPWTFTGKAIFLKRWSPGMPLTKDEHKRFPIWIKLSNLPIELWTNAGLSWIASAIGVPLQLDSRTARMENVSFAKICVEVGVDDHFPTCIAIKSSPESDSTSMVNVEYNWKPTRCGRCHLIGHVEAKCQSKNASGPDPPISAPVEIVSRDQSKPPPPESILNPVNGSRVNEDPLFLPMSLQRSNSGHSLDATSSVIQRNDSALSDDVQWGLYETQPSGDMNCPCDVSTMDKGPIVDEPGTPPLPPLPGSLSLCPQASSGPAPILSYSEIVVRNLNPNDLPIDNVLLMPISNEDRLDALGNHSKAHEIFFPGGSAHHPSSDVKSQQFSECSMTPSDATGLMARKISADIPLPDGAVGALRVDQAHLLAASVSSGHPDAHLLGMDPETNFDSEPTPCSISRLVIKYGLQSNTLNRDVPASPSVSSAEVSVG